MSSGGLIVLTVVRPHGEGEIVRETQGVVRAHLLLHVWRHGVTQRVLLFLTPPHTHNDDDGQQRDDGEDDSCNRSGEC